MEKKIKEKRNIFFKIINIISAILACLLLFYIFRLNMLTFKYFAIIFAVLAVIYGIFFFFNFNKKTRLGIRIVLLILELLFSVVFVFGMHYIDKTATFLHAITGDLEQTEEYYVKVLNNSKYKSISDLKNKTIGAYINSEKSNTKEAINNLKKEIKFEYMSYSDISLMLEDLENGEIDAIVTNESLESLLAQEFKDLELDLRKIYSVFVNVKLIDASTKVKDVTKSKFNIFIAGGDAYGTVNKVMNTDVNMVVSVDPVNKKVLLTSIPRDYYVNLVGQGTNAYDKLTHAGYYGIQESIMTVENLLDIDINYYVKMNFSTVEGIVDAVGGLDVNSDFNFCTTGYCYKEGINHLDGSAALAFARERYTFVDGDVQRVKNQQYVISALIKKISSSTALITGYTDILKAVSNNLVISMEQKDISKLVKMQLKDMASWKIESQNLVGHDAMKTTYSYPTMELYVMTQDSDSVKNARKKINDFLGE